VTIKTVNDDGTIPGEETVLPSAGGLPSSWIDITKGDRKVANMRCDATYCVFPDDVARKIKDTADDLAKTSPTRPKTYILDITGGSRTYDMQKALYEQYGENAQRAAPPNPRAPHILGRAIDITFIDTGANKALDTGPTIMYDTPAQREKLFTAAQIANQKLIEQEMCSLGWIRYDREWWHFEYGTDRWQRGTAQQVCTLV